MWLSGFWGWGEADPDDWQSLYRVEGARRALKAAIAEAGEQRRLVLAWDEREARDKVAVAAMAAAARERVAAAYSKRRLEEAEEAVERERWIKIAVAEAQKRVTPRTVWAAWAWSTGMRQRDIGDHLGVTGSVIGQECHKYVTAFWPKALSTAYGFPRICVNVQQVLEILFRGKPEPPRPAQWREPEKAKPGLVPPPGIVGPRWPKQGASVTEWRRAGMERHRWVYARRLEGWAQLAIGDALGLSSSRVAQMLRREERRRRQLPDSRWSWYLARQDDLGRPVDMGGPRDVWLTYLPSPDPRLDNMVPVT